MKIGDKVRVVNRYSHNDGKTGIVVGIIGDGKINVYFTITDWICDVGDLELVEEATYIPVPKFKVGDTVWFKADDGNIYSGLVVKDRDDKIQYKLYVENYPTKQYIGYGSFINYEDTLVDIAEDKLSKEKPE